MEIAVLIISGVAGAVSFINTIVTNKRLRNGLKKAKIESERATKNLEKLTFALGIHSEDGDHTNTNTNVINSPYELNTPANSDTNSNISVHGVKYNRKTGELSLPPSFEMIATKKA